MNNRLIPLILLIAFFAGAYFHEKDMERNFLKTGNAEAWFSDISCKELKND